MFDRIRRRLTLGYVGILALILALFVAILAFSFSQRLNAQQDEKLNQAATSEINKYFTSSGKFVDVKSNDESDIAVVALPPDGSTGGDVRVLASSSTALGLPHAESAGKAVQKRQPFPTTINGPEGKVRVVNRLLTDGSSGEILAVVQAAQSREAVTNNIRNLLLVLIPVGVGALLLSAVGGLFMSRRAMRPVQDSFARQRTFIADASHELKTPLTLIRADAEVLQREMTDPDQRELADDLLSETDRMDAVLSDLLLLTRLDAGKLSVAQEAFDLSRIIVETADRFGARAEAGGVELATDVPGKLVARGDEARTGQILAALLDNALHFTPKGGRITVTGTREDGRMRAAVTDTGPGIPPEHLPRIFDRFYRAEESRTRSGGGTGLGLSIARDLARAQDGELVAETTKDGGA
ncbi:MAG: HAMP domain-containing sensor histidine kinase, partial [Rubrobacteraceae bacterium]